MEAEQITLVEKREQCRNGQRRNDVLRHRERKGAGIHMSLVELKTKTVMSKYSNYAYKLEATDRDRYCRKLKLSLDGQDILLPDPYALNDGWFNTTDPSKLPPVQYLDIYNYLVNTPGPCTGEALRAYKSLDTYNYYVCGHVKNIRQHNIYVGSQVIYIAASVNPGQRVTEPAYKPWVCLHQKNGYIVGARCTCAAGL